MKNFRTILLASAAIGAALATQSATAQSLTLTHGVTSVRLNAGFLGALNTLNIAPSALPGSQLFSRRGDVFANFPISDGEIQRSNAAGEIIHTGGLRLVRNNTDVRLRSFVINTTGTAPVLTGIAVVNGAVAGRITLFNVALPTTVTFPLATQRRRLRLSGVGLTLNAGAATTLNQVFGVTGFTAGLPIGTAEVSAFTL